MDLLFPKGFVFGISESDLQTVGSLLPQQKENTFKTSWDIFAKKQKIDEPLNGSFKYLNYKQDAKLLTELGIKAYRTSISMSRTIDKNGHVNKKAIQWYRNYLQLLKNKGIQIHLCLYHWEAPEQFSKNGILDKNFADYFLKHVKIVLENLSDLVDYFIPFNESWCICYLSYFVGIHAPGYKNINKFFKAYFSLLDLQTKTIHLIKTKNKKVGLVNIHFPTYIQKQSGHQQSFINAREIADNLTNYIYSDPWFFGNINKSIISKFKKYFPKNFLEIIKNCQLGQSIDYYGINYYNSQFIKPAKNLLGYEQEILKGALTNSLGWPIAIPPHYPNGLTDILVNFTNRYSPAGLKKIMITENGVPGQDDNFRIFFIKKHLKQIQLAISKGALIKGYFHWTLLDNYEWQEGYKPESAFGLVAVDSKTSQRLPKKSFFWYKNLIKCHLNK